MSIMVKTFKLFNQTDFASDIAVFTLTVSVHGPLQETKLRRYKEDDFHKYCCFLFLTETEINA